MLILFLGAVLVADPVVDAIASRTGLPRVSLLLLLGLLLASGGPAVVSAEVVDSFPVLAEIALAMVGFLLGGEFVLDKLKAHGRAVLALSVGVTLVTGAVVTLGAWLAGLGLAVALVLGAASTATDPAAVLSVTRDSGSEGPVTSTLLGVVAVDDVWGLLAFGAVLGALDVLLVTGGAEGPVAAVFELGGSILLGVAVGLPMAWMTGRLLPGTPTLVEALGFVLLVCGLAEIWHLSYLLATVTLGAVVSNFATHHELPFHEIEHIERPFLTLFFVLSGATVQLHEVGRVLPVLGLYVVLRVVGRVAGGWISTTAGRLEDRYRWAGFALLPQAGVALGMALVATERHPELGQSTLAVLVLATVVFETVGPLLTRRFVAQAGEFQRDG